MPDRLIFQENASKKPSLWIVREGLNRMSSWTHPPFLEGDAACIGAGGYPGLESDYPAPLTVAGQRRTSWVQGTGFPLATFASGREATYTDIQLSALSIDIP
jgi:hypothetical protein